MVLDLYLSSDRVVLDQSKSSFIISRFPNATGFIKVEYRDSTSRY